MDPAEVELTADDEVTVTRNFDASAKLVWRANTEPELMKKWLLGPPGWSMPVCEMDVRIGGKFKWRWRNDEDSTEFGFTGEFTAVEPYGLLEHTENFDPGDLGEDMGGTTLVTATFEEADGVTTMVTRIKYKSKSDRDAALATGMTDGMEASYSLLDSLLKQSL